MTNKKEKKMMSSGLLTLAKRISHMKTKKETKVQELERRILALEKRPFDIPIYPNGNGEYNFKQFHYHNGQPCYNNPCVFCQN